MNRYSSTARAQRIDDADEGDADHADYRRMIERFDYLWAAVPSQRGEHETQQEMQQLLLHIEQCEAAQRDGAIQAAGAERKSTELPHRITVAQNPST